MVRLSAIGDVVNTLPALTALRQRLPHAHIGWLVEDSARAAVEGHACVDAVIVYERKRITRALRAGRFTEAARTLAILRRRLRRERFDISLDFHGNLKSAALGLSAGCPTRIGYDRHNCREGNHLFTNVHVPLEKRRIHRVEKHLTLLRALGVDRPTPAPAFGFPVPSQARRWADAILRELSNPGAPTVLLHPGTSPAGAFKRWPVEGYARLAEGLVRAAGARILVTHGAEERALAEAVARRSAVSVALPATRSLGELAALIERASLFVSADTGPMHIAAALQVPVVALFGPKDPVIYGPYGTKSLVIEAGVPCQPCGGRRCEDPRCMRSIDAQKVLEAALDLLDGRPARVPPPPQERCSP